MILRRSAVAIAAAALLPVPALAGNAFDVRAGRIAYFSNGLFAVARNGAAVRAGPLTAGADACAIDLRTDRLVLAGHAWVAVGGHRVDADAIALDLDERRADTLAIDGSAVRYGLDLAVPASEAVDPARFAFPDADDARAYIRSKTMTVTPHASARFLPATFPTSVGAVPVPSYLVDYAVGTGWGASSLPGATFDQPYHLVGTPHALTSLHARYLDGRGAALALDQHLVANDDAYLVASIDDLTHTGRVAGVNAYRRAGAFALSGDGTAVAHAGYGHVAAAVPLRRAGARVDYRAQTGGYSSLDLTLRGPEQPLPFGATWRPEADLGFDAQHGGLLTALPDRSAYGTVWRRDLGVSVSSAVVAGPLGSRIGATAQAMRRWYAFPHQRDSVGANATMTKRFSRAMTGSLTYAFGWFGDDWFGRQRLFYPVVPAALIAPDGTPWPGYAAYAGFATSRGFTFDLTDAPVPDVSFRLSLRTADDFPQFHGFGRPPAEVRFDARFRPLPNVGIVIGRAYDFAWGGTRWQPRWSFAILP